MPEQTVKFELNAFWFHRLLDELEFGMFLLGQTGDTKHNPTACECLYKMLGQQVGMELTTPADLRKKAGALRKVEE